MIIKDFAILAPVPLEHLQSGVQIAQDTGFVAFGSRKWELFRKIDQMRAGNPVPVLIYPSHEDVPASASFIVSWKGWYLGSEEAPKGRHSTGMTHRPPTTGQYEGDNHGHWAVFWHIQSLTELPPAQRLPISSIQTITSGWRKEAPPRGPELVAPPSTIEFPL